MGLKNIHIAKNIYTKDNFYINVSSKKQRSQHLNSKTKQHLTIMDIFITYYLIKIYYPMSWNLQWYSKECMTKSKNEKVFTVKIAS